MANAAQVLLKLLKHTSPTRLEVMLDPVELLGLLSAFGWKKEEVEAELKKGRKPGELLLQLFEEHGSEAVWQALPPRSQSKATEAEKADAERTENATVTGQLAEVGLHRRRLGGAIVALTGSVWAAMYILGSTPDWGRGMTLGTVAFAVVCGVVGGAWSTRDAVSSAGALGGLVCALTTLTIAWIVSGHLESEPGRLVVLGVVLPGALLGFAVAGYGLRRWKKEVQGF